MRIPYANLWACLAIAGLAWSCQETEIEKPEAGHPTVEETVLADLVQREGLEGMDHVFLNGQAIALNALTPATLETVAHAFATYPTAIYNQDQKAVTLYDRKMSDEEIDQLSFPKKDAIGATPAVEGTYEKVGYSIQLFEHKNYGGQMKAYNGTYNLKRGQTRSVAARNVGGSFNDKCSSFKAIARPHNRFACSVQARFVAFDDANYGKYMFVTSGYTDYGGLPEYGKITMTSKDLKDYDWKEEVWWLGWYVHYKTHSHNDKLTSCKLDIQRKL